MSLLLSFFAPLFMGMKPAIIYGLEDREGGEGGGEVTAGEANEKIKL